MRLVAAAMVVALSTTAAGTASAADPRTAEVTGLIRVDQVGYASGEAKHAYLMTDAPAPGVRFTVVDSRGTTVLAGKAGPRTGAWNAAYPEVRPLDLTRLRRPGTYRVRVGKAISPSFRVGAATMFRAPADDAAGFFGTQRDGADVIPGELARGPAHLGDRTAKVYAWPVFTGPDTDEIAGGLVRDGGTADVEGGWFDAGDFLKFTHTAAFADTLLWAARRDGGPDSRIDAEARHGLDWLGKMWDARTKTLYLQVGIGSGDAKGTFAGDHDTWRPPEQDDADRAKGHQYLRSRPVFRAADPGKPISPNLAGRVSAAFALAAQVERDPRRARTDLATAARIYAMARTTHVGELATGLPHAFYPEDAWRDDMELGGAELALAARRLGDPRERAWLAQAATWAGRYVAHDGGDTFNLYDVSALAHADLVRAAAGRPAERDIVQKVKADLKAQLARGEKRAGADPFRAGTVYDDFDSVPHAFGLVATERLYRAVSGDRSHDAFATAQRDWVFGANAWGASFMVGEGTTFERCPQHVVANLSGRTDGRRPIARGAVVNGPNGTEVFEDGLDDYLDGMNHCPPDGADPYARFTGHGSRYVDDVRSWQTSEPADDFTALGLYALTLTAANRP